MATGKPFNTQYDRTQNYKDYMKNLDLQIKNNKTNYDANILYKNTGVPTQPLDTRTYAEKHADIAQLKVSLRGELRILLDDNVITQVFRELNDEQIQFLAGIAPALIAELKPKYSVGMTSHHFIDILDKKVRQETDFSLQSEMLGTLADQLDTISDNMVTAGLMEELIDTVEHSKFTRTGENKQIINFLRSINREMGQTQDLMEQISNIRSGEAQIAENYAKTAGQEAIHTQDILATMNDKILNFQALEELLRGVSIENAEMTQEALVGVFQHMPTKGQVERMIDVIQRADRAGDREGLDEALRDIRDGFAAVGGRLDAYNDDLTEAITASATAQAAAMNRMRLGLGAELGGISTDVGGLRENVGGLREDVGAMNMALTESIADTTNEVRGVRTSLDMVAADITAIRGAVNSLTELYTNISRQVDLLGGLQEGQAKIRETLDGIEGAIVFLNNQMGGIGKDVNDVNEVMIMTLDEKLKGLNTAVLTTGVTPDVLEETSMILKSMEKGLDLPSEEYQRERDIDRGREQVRQMKGEKKLVFIPDDDFKNKGVGEVKQYLAGLWNMNDEELRKELTEKFGVELGPKGGLKVPITKDNLPVIKLNYRKGVEARAREVLSGSAKVPIFASPEEAYKTPSTSEAVGDVFGRITPTGLSPRSQRLSSLIPLGETARRPPVRETMALGYGSGETVDFGSGEVTGRGILSKHKGVGVRMTGRGVAPKEKYIPLGKYLVNIHKLEHNNIVSFKSPNHKSTNIQSKRVSQPVADILLHIVNGTLDEIVTDNLSEDDISYLFQLIKKCELDNFLDGKAENKVKTKTEQEIHNFYVLQGEIVAGNDNPQIIREFKAILLTMMNEGKLSKKEAGDVLIQMSLLGI